MTIEHGVQFGLRGDLAGTYGEKWIATAETGPIVNVTPRSAIGLTGFCRTRPAGFERWSGGVRGRYRRWIDPTRAVDVSLGPEFNVRALAGQVAYVYDDKIAAIADVEVQRPPSRRTHVAVFLGLRIGAGYAIATTAATAALVGLAHAIEFPPD